MRGLDPRIHLFRKKHVSKTMDCRVKPGNDEVFAHRETCADTASQRN
jgi:hypothetical protein